MSIRRLAIAIGLVALVAFVLGMLPGVVTTQFQTECTGDPGSLFAMCRDRRSVCYQVAHQRSDPAAAPGILLVLALVIAGAVALAIAPRRAWLGFGWIAVCASAAMLAIDDRPPSWGAPPIETLWPHDALAPLGYALACGMVTMLVAMTLGSVRARRGRLPLPRAELRRPVRPARTGE